MEKKEIKKEKNLGRIGMILMWTNLLSFFAIVCVCALAVVDIAEIGQICFPCLSNKAAIITFIFVCDTIVSVICGQILVYDATLKKIKSKKDKSEYENNVLVEEDNGQYFSETSETVEEYYEGESDEKGKDEKSE